jgi:hypothetical protein
MIAALVAATMLASPLRPLLPAPLVEPLQSQLILPSGEVFTITEKLGAASLAPTSGRPVLSECEVRLIGRGGLVILDTESRGLTYWVESNSPATSLIELALIGLGPGGTRVVSQPDTGLFLWVSVLRQRSG